MIEINKETKTVYLIGANSAQSVISTLMKAGGNDWKEWTVCNQDYFFEETISDCYNVPDIMISQYDLFNHISEQ